MSVAGCTNDTAASDSLAATTSPTDAVVAAEGRTWIDVRTPEEVHGGRLEGALHIDLQGPDFRSAIAELPRDGAYFVYCRSGNRSGQAVTIMAELGFTDVVDGGGYASLVRAGLPAA